MNITDAQALLVGFFIKSDSITNEQFNSLAPKKTPITESEAAFSYALQSWEEKQIVAKFASENNEKKIIYTWVLKKPLVMNSQFVEIDGNISMSISQAVNNFFKQMGNTENYCNPLNITQADLEVLIEMLQILATGNISQENKQ